MVCEPSLSVGPIVCVILQGGARWSNYRRLRHSTSSRQREKMVLYEAGGKHIVIEYILICIYIIIKQLKSGINLLVR